MRLLLLAVAAAALVVIARARGTHQGDSLPDEMAAVQSDRYWLAIPGPATGQAWRN